MHRMRDETLFIVGHELGHYVLHHIERGLAWGAAGLMAANSQTTNPNAPLMILCFAAISGSLLLAGFLAFSGSGSYKQWRRANRLHV